MATRTCSTRSSPAPDDDLLLAWLQARPSAAVAAFWLVWPLSTATGPCSGSAGSACTTNQRDRPLERADGSAPVAGFGSAPTDTSAVSALAAAGSTVPVEPGVPGGPAPRLRPGDTLVVWRLDRLGRSLRHLIDVVTGLDERGVGFRSLRERIDTTTAGGRLVFHLFGALAQFEREIIRDASTSRLTIGPPAHVPPGVNAARGGRVRA